MRWPHARLTRFADDRAAHAGTGGSHVNQGVAGAALWAASALLAGLTAATYVRAGPAPSAAPDRSRRAHGMTLLATFVVGCPVCNKLVVALPGVSGALSSWAPLQPGLGVLSVTLLLTGLSVRLRGDAACSAPIGPWQR